MFVLVGIILLFVGLLICTAVSYGEPPDPADYDAASMDRYADDLHEYNNAVKNTYTTGRVIMWIGALLIVMVLYLVGMSDTDVPVPVRAALLTTATAVLVVSMILSVIFMGKIGLEW